MSSLDQLARRLWTVAEPVHAVTYFAPEAHQAYVDAGLTGFWRGYFAGRAAPMGTVTAGPVIAAFYNFQPDFVRRAVPDVWTRITPEQAIQARQSGAAGALGRLAGEEIDGAGLPELHDLLRRAVTAMELDAPGRPLFAANLELAWPEEPLAAVWHGTTLLREHRGDGHVAALAGAELDGCEAHLLRLAVAAQGRGWLESARGWSEPDQQAAIVRLSDRGLIGASGEATDRGRALVAEVEGLTDRLAARPLDRLGDAGASRLVELLTPVASAITATGAIPFPNPIGLAPGST